MADEYYYRIININTGDGYRAEAISKEEYFAEVDDEGDD